jgi:acetolactate synthase regulatory subunit
MSARVSVELAAVDGALVRLLGLVERRGFILRGVQMVEQGDTASLTLDIEARDAGRSLDTLALQLQRLIEVRDVSISSIQAAGARS